MTLSQLARAHRRDLDDLVRTAQNDLRLALDPIDDADQARDLLLNILPRLTAIYGAAAATLAADWYDDLRDATGARKRFIAIPAEPVGIERIDPLVIWGVAPLFDSDPDMAKVLARVGGGLQQLIADAGRQTVTRSSIEDPAARGWIRILSGGCSYCEDLASGTYTEDSADFESHANCGCVAAPGFS